MRIKTQDYNEVTVIELQGELDVDFVEILQNSVTNIVATRHKAGVVLDMSDVGFIDSAGLEKLLWIQNYCSENNCQLRLAGLDENCKKILEVTRLEDEFNCYVELAEAVKSFV